MIFLSDLDLGMNSWMSDPLPEPENDIHRGKIATDEVIARLDDWGRYKTWMAMESLIEPFLESPFTLTPLT